MRTLSRGLSALFALAGLIAAPALAGGTLTPVGSTDKPIEILDHRVEVAIAGSFARTQVTQYFHNPNDRDLEAIYRVPVPEDASLAEMTMFLGELVLEGEVVERERARQSYEQERDAGQGAGLAEQQASQVFDFHVSPVPAGGKARFRYVYYQPLELDTGVGRYVYPLEDGGTDELATQFWTQETRVQREFSFRAAVESAWPISDLRLAGLESVSHLEQRSEQRWEVSWESSGGTDLDRDLVLYWRLADDLPGRIELLPFRDDASGPGTFMLIVTPGIDLAPLTGGVDYLFVLDVSGSMKGKLATLAEGVARALGELDPRDRFRLVAFNDRARDLTGGYLPAVPELVASAVQTVRGLSSERGTDLYQGLALGLTGLDADRATSLILVTDGVANQGVVDPREYEKLLKAVDLRLFGFLLGNSANWPLMETISEASGGFYASISNADDVLGQILLAKSKVTHAALHDVELEIQGVHTFDTGLGAQGKVYRGEQLVIFGRYAGGGPAHIELRARITGQDRVYTADFEFPELDAEHPELERMWALDRIQTLEREMDRGLLSSEEGEGAIADLGVAYQLVTDQTSMLVLEDTSFEALGIERHNRERVGRESAAQAARQGRAPRNLRVDVDRPAFPDRAPNLNQSANGNGAGALDPVGLGLAAVLVLMSVLIRWRR